MNSKSMKALLISLVMVILVALPAFAFNGNGLELKGTAGYAIKGPTLTIKVEKLINERHKSTGPLRFTVWATKDAYKGGDIKGFKLGTYNMKSLASGYKREVVVPVKLTKPPKGDYRIVMTVDEFTSGSYKLADFVNFEKALSF
jgi:hypothetical protein